MARCLFCHTMLHGAFPDRVVCTYKEWLALKRIYRDTHAVGDMILSFEQVVTWARQQRDAPQIYKAEIVLCAERR